MKLKWLGRAVIQCLTSPTACARTQTVAAEAANIASRNTVSQTLNLQIKYISFTAENKEIVDSRLRRRCANRVAYVFDFIAEQNLVGISALCLSWSPRSNTHRAIKTRRHPQNREYMSCRNAIRWGPSHGHRRYDKNLVKFGRVVYELCKRTDRQTNWSQHFAPLLRTN